MAEMDNNNSSNSGAAGSQTESKSTESKTAESKATETSKSSGNFSGGFDSSALSDKSLSTDSTPDFGIDFGTNNNKSFGFGDNVTTAPDLTHDNKSNRWDNISDYEKDINGKYSFMKGSDREPVMTVDEVYGKGNQSIVERQGDYAASSNEKSNVETSTFGKQDEISVTPTSVTENKGIVGNDSIQSVEGLDFQQKDKANQEVMEAKKSRDEVEAEDKTNQMKDSLLANIGKPIGSSSGKPGNGDVSQFQLGDRNEDVAAAQAEVDRLSNEKAKYENEFEKNAKVLKGFEAKVTEKQQAIEQEDADYQAKKANAEQLGVIGQKMQEFEQRYQEIADKGSNLFNKTSIQAELDELGMETFRLGKQLGFNHKFTRSGERGVTESLIPENPEEFQTWKEDFIKENFEGLKDFSPNSINAYKAGIDEMHLTHLAQYTDELDNLVGGAKLIKDRQAKLQGLIADNEKKSIEAKTAYDNLVNETYVGEETPATTTPATTTPATTTVEQSNAEKALEAAENEINNSKDLTPEQKAELTESLDRVKQSMQKVQDAAAKARSGNQVDLVAYENAVREYNSNLKDALNRGSAITQTDLNKVFTRSIAAANDFDVTLADGTKMKYDQFAIGEAAKSPDYAEAIYNQQADDYANKAATATNGIMKTYYNVKSELASWKAQLSKDWLGSKVVGADNAFRDQFTQMAKTDMRATANAYNNVLNDKTGKYSEADKAEASAAINQANSLMTASAALQASTGAFSGIGDDVKDGTYGTTNPEDLKLHQRILNKVDNIAKITLGLGVTPAANKAWENMYYMAGDKASQSNIFNRDWDKDGLALCQEYGNNAAAGMIAGVGELGLGIALSFSPSTMVNGADLIMDSVKTFIDSLYGVRKAAKKAVKANNEILGYFNEARDIVKSSGNEDAIKAIDDAASMFLTQTKQTEDFQLKSDEVGNLDNWLEGSGSNTADNGKFNQALTYDEWLKLIEADPVMREYAKSLNR